MEKEVVIMTGYLKGTKYAIRLHRVISKTIKELGIAEKLPTKEKSEKISKFNALLREKFEELNIKKNYALVIAVKIKGDEKDFTLEPYRIFILRPFAVIEGEEFKVVDDEEFEKLYEETVETVMGQELLKEAMEKSKKKKKEEEHGEEEEESKNMSLLDFINS